MDVTKVTKPARKVVQPKYCGAVIVAAGNASRMDGIDKVMAPLQEAPVIVHTVRAFEQCDAIREIVVVTRQDLIVPISDLCHGFSKLRAVVVGGKSREESVHLGLNALSKQVRLAAVQDGARPLVTWKLIDRVVRAASAFGAAVPAVAVKDTIKVAQGGFVKATPNRNALRAVQTPQVFDFDLLRGALKMAREQKWEITDDCSAVERMGVEVRVVPGDERNIKITTPMDLKIARLLLEEEI